jgi:hypothetical protein
VEVARATGEGTGRGVGVTTSTRLLSSSDGGFARCVGAPAAGTGGSRAGGRAGGTEAVEAMGDWVDLRGIRGGGLASSSVVGLVWERQVPRCPMGCRKEEE